MKGLLLDSHVLLWWLEDPENISATARDQISSAESSVFVSIAAPWELAIKENAGKLRTPSDLQDRLTENRFELLPITLSHIEIIKRLPLHHRDPFDRIMVAQAIAENLTLVTRDTRLPSYEIDILSA